MPSSKPRPDVSRAVGRLSTEYVLRALQLIAEIEGGDLVRAIIGQAIIAANTAHLERDRSGPAYAGRLDVPPDSARRPISVLALSQSLGLPFETTRRHVNKLIASGRCRRVTGGVIVPAEVLASMTATEAGEKNLEYVYHFLRGLRRVGVQME
jgi:hypothetical protein